VTFKCEETTAPPANAQFANAAAALQFMLGGNATVTLVSKKTEARFTYRITANDDGTTHFVMVLRGADNEADYSYLGRIVAYANRNKLWIGRKVPRAGDIGADAPSARAFEYAWHHLSEIGQIPAQLEVWHQGKCGRCGRKLTVPASIASGFGPECINYV
jgi:hypothetical protein